MGGQQPGSAKPVQARFDTGQAPGSRRPVGALTRNRFPGVIFFVCRPERPRFVATPSPKLSASCLGVSGLGWESAVGS